MSETKETRIDELQRKRVEFHENIAAVRREAKKALVTTGIVFGGLAVIAATIVITTKVTKTEETEEEV